MYLKQLFNVNQRSDALIYGSVLNHCSRFDERIRSHDIIRALEMHKCPIHIEKQT